MLLIFSWVEVDLVLLMKIEKIFLAHFAQFLRVFVGIGRMGVFVLSAESKWGLILLIMVQAYIPVYMSPQDESFVSLCFIVFAGNETWNKINFYIYINRQTGKNDLTLLIHCLFHCDNLMSTILFILIYKKR